MEFWIKSEIKTKEMRENHWKSLKSILWEVRNFGILQFFQELIKISNK